MQRVLPQVYDESLSYSELLGKALHLLNQVIDTTNEYFSSEYLEGHVNKKLSEWLQDGTLEQIINVDIFNDLRNKIRKVITPEDFGAVGDGVTDDIQAFEQMVQYSYDNNSKMILSNKVYGISRTLYVYEHQQMEGLSDTVIKALNNFSGDSVIKSYDYDNVNIQYFGIFNIAIDGNWQYVYGVRLKIHFFAYGDLMVSKCLLGGLHTDSNETQNYRGSEKDYGLMTKRFKSGRFEGFNNGGTTFYWNHKADSWIGEVEARGINIADKLNSDSDVSKCGVHVGPGGQCEIDRVHLYGFKDCMISESRITATLLILESYFDRALWLRDNATFSQIDRIEVFQNLSPTGPYTGLSEGKNDVPVVHLDAFNGVQINNLFIRQFWSDPEKINDESASTNPTYQTILNNRKTKKCLVIDGAENHIGNLYIIGKLNGGAEVQAYYPIGLVNNGNNNKVNEGQVNYCSTGLITESKSTGGNFIKLNMFSCDRGWLNTLGVGDFEGNKYFLYYKNYGQGAKNLFHENWDHIDLSVGERMEYTWCTGGNVFQYPSVTTKTYDLGTVGTFTDYLENNTGKMTLNEEINIQIISDGTTAGLLDTVANLSNHTTFGSDLHFSNNVQSSGITATVIVKIGI